MSKANSRLSLHVEAVNLARRYTVQNENDLMQEVFVDSPTTTKKVVMDHDGCAELSQHLHKSSGLPQECMKFDDIVSSLKRRDSDTTHPTQYLS